MTFYENVKVGPPTKSSRGAPNETVTPLSTYSAFESFRIKNGTTSNIKTNKLFMFHVCVEPPYLGSPHDATRSRSSGACSYRSIVGTRRRLLSVDICCPLLQIGCRPIGSKRIPTRQSSCGLRLLGVSTGYPPPVL